MEEKTLKVVNQKIRDLIQNGDAVSINIATDLIYAINGANQLGSKTFIDKLIDEASEKSNTSGF